jgi:hypothetical protein
MRNHKLLILVGASITSILSGLLPAVAAPDLTYNGASTYKDAKDNVYRVTTYKTYITYDNVEVIKAPISDACGFTRLSLNSNTTSTFPTTITLNGSSDTLGSMPIVTEKNPYKCTNGVVTWKGTAQTSVFQTSVNNNGVITKNIYYPPARTGGISKQGLISYTASLFTILLPKTCGFIVTPGYANSQKKTSSTLLISDSLINIATLPINPSPPECVGGKTLTGNATNVATFNGATLYRTTKNIYFTGLTPRSLNVVGYDALSSNTFSTTSTCGLIRVGYKTVPTSIKIAGSSYTPATMSRTNNLIWMNCTSSDYVALANNKLYMSDGITYLYKTSDLTLKKLITETPTVITNNIPVNACGFAVIPALNTANGFTAGDKVTINGSTPYDVMTLPLATTAPTCKNGVTYLVSN